MKIICLTPVYNDWASLSTLIKELKSSARNNNWNLASLVAVNDCSSDNYTLHQLSIDVPIKILNLSLNVGHQRAIANWTVLY